jgi:hypothetical protein
LHYSYARAGKGDAMVHACFGECRKRAPSPSARFWETTKSSGRAVSG